MRFLWWEEILGGAKLNLERLTSLGGLNTFCSAHVSTSWAPASSLPTPIKSSLTSNMGKKSSNFLHLSCLVTSGTKPKGLLLIFLCLQFNEGRMYVLDQVFLSMEQMGRVSKWTVEIDRWGSVKVYDS
ncbi:hypothetical protein LXL04_004196 [Taraxacum kok-saghyz]